MIYRKFNPLHILALRVRNQNNESILFPIVIELELSINTRY